MGRFSSGVPDNKTVLTHCNAGALATAGYGTALGVIRAAVSMGKKIDVFADETRPFLQGARLTAWELQQDGIATTLITDNMAGHFLKSGRIGCVVVGADRIAGNGDVANKIGTYSVAVLAKENGVPFFVAAPISTLDLTLESGDQIPIEQRSAAEVTHVFGVAVAPKGTSVQNPAFDVTPNRLCNGNYYGAWRGSRALWGVVKESCVMGARSAFSSDQHLDGRFTGLKFQAELVLHSSRNCAVLVAQVEIEGAFDARSVEHGTIHGAG